MRLSTLGDISVVRLLFCTLVVCSLSVDAVSQDSRPVPAASKGEQTIADMRIDESSGLAKSRSAKPRWWTHNDSGDKPRLFAIEIPEVPEHEVSVFAVDIENAKAIDWEDMASGTVDGKDVLWLGDVGDNGARRSHVMIYLVDEPAGPLRDGDKISVRGAWAVEYEDGPRDCEAIAYDSASRALYLLAKGKLPWAGLYRVTLADLGLGGNIDSAASAESGAGKSETVLRDVSESEGRVRARRIANLPIAMATGMDIRQDGLQLAICTYFDCWVFSRKADERWEDVLGTIPVRYALPQYKQIEAIAFDTDGRLWVTSEGEPLRLGVVSVDP